MQLLGLFFTLVFIRSIGKGTSNLGRALSRHPRPTDVTFTRSQASCWYFAEAAQHILVIGILFFYRYCFFRGYWSRALIRGLLETGEDMHMAQCHGTMAGGEGRQRRSRGSLQCECLVQSKQRLLTVRADVCRAEVAAYRNLC